MSDRSNEILVTAIMDIMKDPAMARLVTNIATTPRTSYVIDEEPDLVERLVQYSSKRSNKS